MWALLMVWVRRVQVPPPAGLWPVVIVPLSELQSSCDT
jgi:hypothetical protein